MQRITSTSRHEKRDGSMILLKAIPNLNPTHSTSRDYGSLVERVLLFVLGLKLAPGGRHFTGAIYRRSVHQASRKSGDICFS